MANTPSLPHEADLGPLDSRYVDPDLLPWKPTPSPGIEMKILMQEKESGLLTAQTWVLSGSLVDEEGEALAGQYVWRPKGNRHTARSPEGALVISFFLKPNKFLDGELEGQLLE